MNLDRDWDIKSKNSELNMLNDITKGKLFDRKKKVVYKVRIVHCAVKPNGLNRGLKVTGSREDELRDLMLSQYSYASIPYQQAMQADPAAGEH